MASENKHNYNSLMVPPIGKHRHCNTNSNTVIFWFYRNYLKLFSPEVLVAGVKYMTSVFRNMYRRMLRVSSISASNPAAILRVNIFWEEGKISYNLSVGGVSCSSGTEAGCYPTRSCRVVNEEICQHHSLLDSSQLHLQHVTASRPLLNREESRLTHSREPGSQEWLCWREWEADFKTRPQETKTMKMTTAILAETLENF